MEQSLLHRIRPYGCVSLIGMCKNAGKTTVLNQLIREAEKENICLGLTSIGRDGEDQDLVTGTKKPEIYVPEGTLFATADSLALRSCDVTKEILDTTDMYTPMGQVVLLKARSDGYIQLAGPSMTSQLALLRQEFFRFGAEKVLLDGALSRKSLCGRHVSEATILCTGASYHKNLQTVVSDTAYQCRILSLPETEDPLARRFGEGDARGLWLLTADGPVAVEGKLEDALRKTPARAIFFGGALTDLAVKSLLMSSVSLKDVALILRDSSKILLKAETFEKILRRGARVEVLESVHLVAVTVNPFSAYGFHFDPKELKETMEQAVGMPVHDVKGGA